MPLSMASKRKQNSVHLPIPRWASFTYSLFCVVLIPWTAYLSWVLPRRHLSPHWDISWVGLDIGILLTLLATALLARRKSRWVAISATMVGTLLLADAWFDTMSSRVNRGLGQALFLALFVELPVAAMSFTIAYRVLDKNID